MQESECGFVSWVALVGRWLGSVARWELLSDLTWNPDCLAATPDVIVSGSPSHACFWLAGQRHRPHTRIWDPSPNPRSLRSHGATRGFSWRSSPSATAIAVRFPPATRPRCPASSRDAPAPPLLDLRTLGREPSPWRSYDRFSPPLAVHPCLSEPNRNAHSRPSPSVSFGGPCPRCKAYDDRHALGPQPSPDDLLYAPLGCEIPSRAPRHGSQEVSVGT